MKKHWSLMVTGLLLVILLFVIARKLFYKTVAPEIKFYNTLLTNVDNGQLMSIADQQGKVCIVSCFQTWCRDCAAETPLLNTLAAKLDSGKFKVILITDEKNGKLRAFRERLVSNNILFVTTPKKLEYFGVHVYPTTFLLNKEGHAVMTKLEGHDWSKEEPLIRELMER